MLSDSESLFGRVLMLALVGRSSAPLCRDKTGLGCKRGPLPQVRALSPLPPPLGRSVVPPSPPSPPPGLPGKEIASPRRYLHLPLGPTEARTDADVRRLRRSKYLKLSLELRKVFKMLVIPVEDQNHIKALLLTPLFPFVV